MNLLSWEYRLDRGSSPYGSAGRQPRSMVSLCTYRYKCARPANRGQPLQKAMADGPFERGSCAIEPCTVFLSLRAHPEVRTHTSSQKWMTQWLRLEHKERRSESRKWKVGSLSHRSISLGKGWPILLAAHRATVCSNLIGGISGNKNFPVSIYSYKRCSYTLISYRFY